MKAKRLRMKPAHINTLPRSAFVGNDTQPAAKSALDVADLTRLPIPGLSANRQPLAGMPAQTPEGATTQGEAGGTKAPEKTWYQKFLDLF